MDRQISVPIQIQTWQDPESTAIARPVFNTVSFLAFFKSYVLYPIFEAKYNKENLFVFSDPAGDTRNRIKTSSLEIGFLGIKILLVCYESQLNKEWFRIARTIKDMGNRSGPQVFFKTLPYFCRPTPKKWKN